MKKFVISVQIGFYSTPYERYAVVARDKNEALSKVNSMFPKGIGHRFLNVESEVSV